jgi:catechol 2,3-dioxygenase-like lactoylglutathione lyase family enzyme
VVKRRARLIGMNHVAIEVGDLDAALELYGKLFEFELRGRMAKMAFIDMGDQFIAVSEGRTQGPDDGRHFGLVVDDLEAVLAAARDAGLEAHPSGLGGVDIRDPWGNFLQAVAYSDVQFERTAGVKRKLGIEELEKSEKARRQIAERGLD